MTCPRCLHEIVPRCGCGARKTYLSEHLGAGSCSADPSHAQASFSAKPSCLCGRGNVGPDKRTGTGLGVGYMVDEPRTRSERRRARE